MLQLRLNVASTLVFDRPLFRGLSFIFIPDSIWSKRLSHLNIMKQRLIQKYIESVKIGQGRFGIDEANFNKLILYRKGFCQRLKWLIQNYPFEYKSLSVKRFLFWNGHKFYSKRKTKKTQGHLQDQCGKPCQIIQADWQFLKLS